MYRNTYLPSSSPSLNLWFLSAKPVLNAGKTSYHDSSCLFYSNRDNKDDSQRIWLGNPINKQSYVPADLRDFPEHFDYSG